MKQKSIKKNAILNMGTAIGSTLCSVLSLPYVTRVLQPENYGRISYAQSFVSYFSLIAELGILAYAMRECANVRDDRQKYQKLANEMFTFNMCATLISLALSQIVLWTVPGFRSHWILIEIFLVSVIFDTLRVRWLYQSQEDYAYLSLQGLFSHALVLVLIYIFIKQETDYYKYAVILIMPAVIPGIMNIVRSRKYCKLRFTLQTNFKEHFYPIVMIFASNVANTIYVFSDTVILGYITGDYAVGLYAVAIRIYDTTKALLAAAISVTIPRFCYFYNNGHEDEFKKLLGKVTNLIFIICVPAFIGLIILAKEIVLILFGNSYREGTLALQLLSGALLFAVPAMMLSQSILIAMKKEKTVFKVTAFGAILNVVLNIILIPRYAQNAAAFTTLLCEFIVLVIYAFKTQNEWRHNISIKSLLQAMIAGLIMGVIVANVKLLFDNLLITIIVCLIVGVFSYFGILLLFRNSMVCEYLHIGLSRIRKR